MASATPIETNSTYEKGAVRLPQRRLSTTNWRELLVTYEKRSAGHTVVTVGERFFLSSKNFFTKENFKEVIKTVLTMLETFQFVAKFFETLKEGLFHTLNFFARAIRKLSKVKDSFKFLALLAAIPELGYQIFKFIKTFTNTDQVAIEKIRQSAKGKSHEESLENYNYLWVENPYIQNAQTTARINAEDTHSLAFLKMKTDLKIKRAFNLSQILLFFSHPVIEFVELIHKSKFIEETSRLANIFSQTFMNLLSVAANVLFIASSIFGIVKTIAKIRAKMKNKKIEHLYDLKVWPEWVDLAKFIGLMFIGVLSITSIFIKIGPPQGIFFFSFLTLALTITSFGLKEAIKYIEEDQTKLELPESESQVTPQLT